MSTTDGVANADPLGSAVRRFSSAETELRDLLDRAQKLSTAKDELAGARRDMETSQRALVDTASGIYSLTTELKDIARDLKDTAIVLRKVEPERINEQLAAVLTSHRRLRVLGVWILILLSGGCALAAMLLVQLTRL